MPDRTQNSGQRQVGKKDKLVKKRKSEGKSANTYKCRKIASGNSIGEKWNKNQVDYLKLDECVKTDTYIQTTDKCVKHYMKVIKSKEKRKNKEIIIIITLMMLHLMFVKFVMRFFECMINNGKPCNGMTPLQTPWKDKHQEQI